MTELTALLLAAVVGSLLAGVAVGYYCGRVSARFEAVAADARRIRERLDDRWEDGPQ